MKKYFLLTILYNVFIAESIANCICPCCNHHNSMINKVINECSEFIKETNKINENLDDSRLTKFIEYYKNEDDYYLIDKKKDFFEELLYKNISDEQLIDLMKEKLGYEENDKRFQNEFKYNDDIEEVNNKINNDKIVEDIKKDIKLELKTTNLL